jgi:hypothetical protein
MPRPMGLKLASTPNVLFKRKFRWVLEIQNVSGDRIGTLPPQKSARPNINFKTIEAQHLNESIFYPTKPEWKPINLTLYDIIGDASSDCPQRVHPVFEWLKQIYDPGVSDYSGQTGGTTVSPVGWYSDVVRQYKRSAILSMLNGCGDVLEEWVFENAWPESVEFGDLDYANSEVVTADISLRYDRAYVVSSADQLGGRSPGQTGDGGILTGGGISNF